MTTDPFADDYQFDQFDVDFEDDFNFEEEQNFLMTSFGLGGSMEIKRQRSFEIYAEDELKMFSKETVFEVMDILALPSKSISSILLGYFKWNKDNLISSFSENADDISKAAGIVSYDLEEEVEDHPELFECLVCYDEVPWAETYALGCGHRQCNECYRSYLEIKIKEKVDCIRTKCPGRDCGNIVHDRAFKQLCSPEMYKVYKASSFRSLVNDNPHVKYCPSPDCTNMIRCERKNRVEPITCLCGFTFCFNCSDWDIGDHAPCTCDHVADWVTKADMEEHNMQWILAHTKKCPDCKRPIEKNEGCMHMTCQTQAGGCGHEFCWLCRGPWSEHGSETGGYYACNKYDTSEAKKTDEETEVYKESLEYFMWHMERYIGNLDSTKRYPREAIIKKCDEIMAKFEVRAQDTQFIHDAAEQVVHNFRVLANSYIYGYYLDKELVTERNLFEFLQEQLQKNNDTLSGLYDKPLSDIADFDEFTEWKEEVTNFTRVTAQFLDKFISGVLRGLIE